MDCITLLTRFAALIFSFVIAGVATAATQGHLPLAFEKLPDSDAYVLRNSQKGLVLLPGAIRIEAPSGDSPARIELRFGQGTVTPVGEDTQPTVVRYYVGSDSKHWFTSSQYRRVRYREVYPGIDLVFYPSAREVEYDWIVKPGADPSRARMRVVSPCQMTLDPDGNVVLSTDFLRLVQHPPVVYQVTAGRRHRVTARYQKLLDDEIGIEIGRYNREHELVIDPVLQWLSYLGGSGTDTGAIIQAAPDGGSYLAFSSDSPYFYFPTAGFSPEIKNGTRFVVLAKLSKDGNVIERLAYFGGNSNSSLTSLAIDAAGNLYLAGATVAADFPLLNAFRKQREGVEGFILKVTAGFDLVYSSYIGGSRDDIVYSLAVDTTGRAYLTGFTASADFVNVKALETTPGSGFVTRLDPNGFVEYSGYARYGLAGVGIAADSSGAAYVVGATLQSGLGYQGFVANYVLKISADGSQYLYQHTFNNSEFLTISSFRVDAAGTVTFAGFSRAAGGALVAQLDPSGSSQTVLLNLKDGCTIDPSCGAFSDFSFDRAGNLYVVGQGFAINTIGGFESFGPKAGPYSSVFVAKASKSAGIIWSTYLQGSGDDSAGTMSVTPDGIIYVAGQTNSTDFPALGDAGSYEYAGGLYDLWFGRIVENGDTCRYSVNADRSSVSGNGGNGGFRVVVNRPECRWSATPEQGWLTVTSGQNGQGIGRVQFRAETNLSSPRVGRILLNGVPHTIYQSDMNCTYTLPFTRQVVGPQGATKFAIAVAANSGCKWAVTTTEPWITVIQQPPANGGSGYSYVSITGNPGGSRIGQLTVAGQSYQILQGAGASPGTPFITAAGIVNTASYASGVSPGEIVTIYGSFLGPTQLVSGAPDGGQFPATLSGVQVLFNGKAAPLLYVSAGQVSAIVPMAVALNPTVTVQITYNDVRSASLILPISAAIPGLFSANSSGAGPGAILNQDGSVNSAANPASADTVIVLYATGMGTTDTNPPDGSLITGSALPKPTLPIQVLIGGRVATIDYAGAAPFLVFGVFQMNVHVPVGLAVGAQPVTLRVGSANSQTGITVAIK